MKRRKVRIISGKRRWFLRVCLLSAAGFFAAGVRETAPYVQAERKTQALEQVYTSWEAERTPLGRRIDFAGLRKVNPEIVGWIYIPGTQVDYAILQHKGDDGYYLHHSEDGSENSLGAIFLYGEADRSFSEMHTILFGHNMRSGQRFGELSNYRKTEFYQKYPYIYLYLPGKSMRYEIYSAYSCVVEDLTYTTGYERASESYEEFIEHTKGRSEIVTGVSPRKEQNVLTLSTCTEDGAAEKRFVVNAVRIMEDRKEDANEI